MVVSQSRASAVDPLRLVLAAFVVAIHARYSFGLAPPYSEMLANGLYRIAVPTFAVISGYFFFSAMGRGQGGSYIRRILFLFVLWTIIYLPFWIRFHHEPREVFIVAVFGTMHLWYLPGIAVAAGMVMMLKAKGVTDPVILVLAILLAGAGCIGQYLSMRTGAVAVFKYRNGVFSIYPYFAIGWLLHSWGIQHKLAQTPAMLRIGAVLAVSAVAAIEGGLWMGIEGAKSVDNMLSLVIVAPVVFLAALGTVGRWPGKQMAQIATFVYLSHYWFIEAAGRLFDDTIAGTAFIFLASFGMGWALTRLPAGRQILNSAV